MPIVPAYTRVAGPHGSTTELYEHVPEVWNSSIGSPTAPMLAVLATERLPRTSTSGPVMVAVLSMQRLPRTYTETVIVTLLPRLMQPEG